MKAPILAAVVAGLVASANAAWARPSFLDAAELMSEWQYDDAARALQAATPRQQRTPEHRYLTAELAFVRGDYQRSLTILGDLPSDQGPVRDLQKLVTSTYAVTRNFASKRSDGGHFTIYYPTGKDELIVDLTGEVLERAYAVMKADFGYAPPAPVRVEILSDPSDLSRVSTLTEKEIDTTGTIALCKYNKLMVVTPRATLFGYPWMDTMVHEYVHYVVSKSTRNNVPVWLQEGLARFEQSRWRRAPGLALTAVDEHLLATALAKKRLITFDAMHPSMAKLPSQEAATLAFAEVYTMVAYLHGRIGYAGLRKALAISRSGTSVRAALAQVAGETWPEIERGWKRHLAEAGLDRQPALAGRAKNHHIHFKKGATAGDPENVRLDEIDSARARKYARLGGILRVRGMPQAAATEYEKALSVAGSDPLITAKLSRTYLDLGNYARAIELALPIAAMDEDDAAASTTLGVAYLATDDAARAATAFEAALRINPFDPTVRCGLAKAYAAIGKSRLATRASAACVKLR